MAGKGRSATPKAGRQKGTPNKSTREAREWMEANGYDPALPLDLWCRVLKAGMTPLPKGNKPDKAEQFYMGTQVVSDGKDMGSHVEHIYSRPHLPLMLNAADKLAKRLWPELTRILGTGENGELKILFEEDPRIQGKPHASGGSAPQTPAVRVSFQPQAAPKGRRVREL